MAKAKERSAGRKLVRIVGGIIGLGLSLVLLSSAFFHISLQGGLHFTPRFQVGHWVHDLPHHLPWVLAFAALTAAIIPARAFQWGRTLRPPPPSFHTRYHAVALGAFIHNTVPGKLGEFARAFWLSRKAKVPYFQSLGTVLVCKLLEFGALLLVVAVSLAFFGGPGQAKLLTAVGIAAGVFVALTLLLVAAAYWADDIVAWLTAHGYLPRVRVMLGHLRDGLVGVRTPARALEAFLASILPVLAPTIGYGIALQALGVHLGIVRGGVVLGAIALGQLAIGLPVGTGMYYMMSSWAARSLGASDEQAAALAMLTHVTTLLTQILVGAVSLVHQRKEVRLLIKNRARLEELKEHPELLERGLPPVEA